jgi:hypothetical protein
VIPILSKNVLKTIVIKNYVLIATIPAINAALFYAMNTRINVSTAKMSCVISILAFAKYVIKKAIKKPV